MSTWTDLRYGWVILTAMLTGAVTTTIYVANNTRHQVAPVDIIELALGVHERCLATQWRTTPATNYSVDPLIFRLPFTTNSYTSAVCTATYTNASGTNTITGTNWYPVLTSVILTNAIAWSVDRTLMAYLDEKIFQLIPNFVDTNTMQPYTVSGLFTSLRVGVISNYSVQFTRTPAMTNNIAGVITTNPATPGNITIGSSLNNEFYQWHFYASDLDERYRVLNALRVTRHSDLKDISKSVSWPTWYDWKTNWATAKTFAENNIYSGYLGDPSDYYRFELLSAGSVYTNYGRYYAAMSLSRYVPDFSLTNVLNQAIQHTSRFMVKPSLPSGPEDGNRPYFPSNNAVFYDNGFGLVLNQWSEITDSVGTTNLSELPAWCSQPGPESWPLTDAYGVVARSEVRGMVIESVNRAMITDWHFAYCTNRYW